MGKFNILIASMLIASVMIFGCQTVPKSPEARQVLSSEVDQAIAIFKQRDPDIQRFFNDSYGYAVFPKVYKGAFWIGGAYGKGEVYAQDQLLGFSSLSAGTIGFSFGGEYFREIIFFRDQRHLEDFISGDYEFSAQATAVGLTSGAAAKSDYQDGYAVFIIAESGLMVDASIGGQKFTFVPKAELRD